MLAGAFVTGLLGVALVTLVCRYTRTKEDAAIGIVLSTFFGAGVVLSSVIQNLPTASSKAGLQTYIYGQAAGMTRDDVWFIATVAAACLVLVTLVYKEFLVFSFDPGFAHASRLANAGARHGNDGNVGACNRRRPADRGRGADGGDVDYSRARGKILDRSARQHARHRGHDWRRLRCRRHDDLGGRFEQTLGFDPLAFGHNTRNLPTGPVIVLCAATLFLVSLLFAPRRGMLPRVARTLGGRRRIEREPAALAVRAFRIAIAGSGRGPLAADYRRSHSGAQVRRLAGWGARRGLIERTASGPRLTVAGRQRAERLVRTHRLWELFLISGADIAPDHVDRDADSIEHFLTPQLVERLESQLAAEGKLPPVAGEVPDSRTSYPRRSNRRAGRARWLIGSRH